MSNHWPPEVAYQGEPCSRRCTHCPDPAINGNEHHWIYMASEEDPEGRYHCKHCPATREVPIDNEEFLEAFPI